MPIKRSTALAVLASALLASGSLFATTASPDVSGLVIAKVTAPLLYRLPIFNPAPMLAQSVIPSEVVAPAQPAAAAPAPSAASTAGAAVADKSADAQQALDLRKTLVDLAMQLRNSRYVRGGHDPSTGFDCSGFVRYVFAHAIGLELPTNSASQFNAGQRVARDSMKPGDLVFFRTAGRHGKGRISHVGIYLSDGQFIHSPRRGETVRVDSLDESYWAKRFAGAKRPDAMAQIDSTVNNG
jgi:cell wall-associated NlpC family hydrolase